MDKKEIVLFTDSNVALEVPITPEQGTVWLKPKSDGRIIRARGKNDWTTY